MVFCGKPSKGCATCRARKIKCDQDKPSCRRCSNSGRICPGYRNLQDLVFRDQSKRTIDLAQKAKARSDRPATKGLDRLNEKTANAVVSKPPLVWNTACSIPPSLSPRIEDQATWYFFKNYHAEGSGVSKGFFADILPIYSQMQESAALAKSVRSVGMASLSNIRNDPHTLVISRREYSSALRLVNAALEDPVEVKKEQTILAVMLLGLYEIIACDTSRSMMSWIKHINGAVAILQLHGNQLLRSETGIRIFYQLRSQAITSCLQGRVAVHPTIVDWSRKFRAFETANEIPANRLTEILTRLCSIRASVRDGNFTSPAALFSSMLSVDAELESWFTHLPPIFTYSTVATKKNSSNDIYLEHYHVYQHYTIAGILNNYRCTRAIINDKILEFLSSSSIPITAGFALPFDSIQRDTSKSIISELTNEICASVPYYFGFHNRQEVPSHAPKALGGIFLRWPLFIVAGLRNIPESMREWTTAQLHRIAYTMGIKQTMAMADKLKVLQDRNFKGVGGDV